MQGRMGFHRNSKSTTRAVAVVAIAGALLAAGAGPVAAAADDPLAVTSTGLTDGQYIGTRQIIYPTWTGDVTKVEVYENGKLVRTTTGAAKAVQLPAPAPATDGTDMAVTVRVYDAGGNTAEASTEVHVDAVLPHATFSPALTDLLRIGGVFPVTASDLSDDVISIALTDELTGQSFEVVTGAPWTLQWDTVAHPRLVRFDVTDRAGNVMSYFPSWQTDNVPPVIGIPVYYSPGRVVGRVHGVTQLDTPVSDSSGINHWQWWLDGTMISEFRMTGNSYTNGAGLTYDFGTVERAERLELRVWDRAGNESDKTFPIVVDSTGPAVSWASPANGALVRGSEIAGTIYAADPSGVIFAEIDSYDTRVSSSGTHWVGSAPAGADGKHTVSWWVVDGVGNDTRLSRTVTVDNTKPSVKVTKAPANKAKVHGTVKVTASASDRNGVNRVELLINGKVVAKDTTSGYAFSINTAKYGKTIKVQLRAYDKAGNSTITSTRTWHR